MAEDRTVEKEAVKILSSIAKPFVEHYSYAYNIIMAFSKEGKPLTPLIEFEHAFAHLMVAFIEEDTEIAIRNLHRFKGHIERLLLDLYKIAVYVLFDEINRVSRSNNRVLLFKDELRKIRELELKNLGNDKFIILDKYRNLLREILQFIEQL